MARPNRADRAAAPAGGPRGGPRHKAVLYCTVRYGTVRYCTIRYCTVLRPRPRRPGPPQPLKAAGAWVLPCRARLHRQSLGPQPKFRHPRVKAARHSPNPRATPRPWFQPQCIMPPAALVYGPLGPRVGVPPHVSTQACLYICVRPLHSLLLHGAPKCAPPSHTHTPPAPERPAIERHPSPTTPWLRPAARQPPASIPVWESTYRRPLLLTVWRPPPSKRTPPQA
jgi:hypothetical protein